MSRDKILANVAQNQPAYTPLPDMDVFLHTAGSHEKFAEVLTSIGGKAQYVNSYAEIAASLKDDLIASGRIITTIAELKSFFKEDGINNSDALDLHNVELAIIEGEFGVAENGAVWITEEKMGQRVLPFICQHLAVIIHASTILPTMHEAYVHINKSIYGFGIFIAGPSKTADIEQSLVIGAHGPKSMRVFLINN